MRGVRGMAVEAGAVYTSLLIVSRDLHKDPLHILDVRANK